MALRPDAALRLSVSPAEVTLKQGESAELTASVARAPGIEAEFQITPDALPNNAALANAKIEKEQDSVGLSLSIPENVAPGVYTMILKAGGKATISDPRNLAESMEANLSEPSNPIIITVLPKE